MQLSPAPSHSKLKKEKPELADSWEDDTKGSSDSEPDEGAPASPIRPGTSDLPGAPPPTPASPVTGALRRNIDYRSSQSLSYGGAFDPTSYTSVPKFVPTSQGEERRPDKTTSVASRLIAAGIGQKAPKRTQEQRDYDQAMKLQEQKRRDEAREEEERKKRDKEQAQKDIWGD